MSFLQQSVMTELSNDYIDFNETNQYNEENKSEENESEENEKTSWNQRKVIIKLSDHMVSFYSNKESNEIKVAQKYFKIPELINQINEIYCSIRTDYINVKIPDKVIVSITNMYQYCGKNCEKNRCIGKAINFMSIDNVDKKHNDGLVSTLWTLLIFNEGQLLLKSTNERCVMNYRSIPLKMKDTNNIINIFVSANMDIIGSSDCFDNVNGKSNLVGHFGYNNKKDTELLNTYKNFLNINRKFTIDWLFTISLYDSI